MKIMIDFAVPLNNGDAALIFALGDELENMGNQIVYSTFNYKKPRNFIQISNGYLQYCQTNGSIS
ncbi:hypothetical protein RAK27_02055 [Carnobacterium maltaromaticum]|uniref:Uncharacterized protein n=1 Tax=Carnobacterium maltaromaticum TaxID=2751 RepID=A0AAW9JUX4_CARML|nr:hypothetical protein [Carnobacterium maltaromaticum]MDZ5757440.1 hypothetical protein [Carnobacterium maltaromaticum]